MRNEFAFMIGLRILLTIKAPQFGRPDERLRNGKMRGRLRVRRIDYPIKRTERLGATLALQKHNPSVSEHSHVCWRCSQSAVGFIYGRGAVTEIR